MIKATVDYASGKKITLYSAGKNTVIAAGADVVYDYGINALAFSGTNAAFSLLGDHGGAERERHNLAIERLSKAREEP